MATFTFKPHAGFVETLANKEIDLADDALKAVLCSETYVPNRDTHKYYSHVTNELGTGSGYTQGGKALTGVTWSYNSGTRLWTLNASPVTWDPSTLDGRVVVVIDDTPGTAATKPIIGSGVFDGDVISSGGPFSVNWGAGGLFSVQIPA